MLRAARAFLEFSRQATTPVDRTADLNRLIDDALILFKHRSKFQQVRIATHFDPALPQVFDGGLQHAAVNLIKNAFDAMPRGGTLTITTRCDEGHVELEVEDTGAGVPDEVRPRLFQPFFSTKPIHQGSGLGLVIAKEAVERSGGSIEFSSQIGIGTTFRMHVPASTAEAPIDGA
jgi:signal transduction histidine kinase